MTTSPPPTPPSRSPSPVVTMVPVAAHPDDLALRLQEMKMDESSTPEASTVGIQHEVTMLSSENVLEPSNTSSMPETPSQTPTSRPSTPRSEIDLALDSVDMLPAPLSRPRNRSPYSRGHFRSSSSSSTLSAPPMTRAHSLPTVISSSNNFSLSPSPLPLARPSSPLRSPKRTRSPFRSSDDQYVHSGAPSVCDISEDAELELTPKTGGVPIIPYTQHIPSSPLANSYNGSNPLLRSSSRRRPASPLCNVSVPFGSTASQASATPGSGRTSPMLGARFNEPFPGANAHYPSSLTSSSVPSTPTSLRSRSPSISSLETIPDIPDAEAEAVEADRIARLKAAADKEKEAEDNTEGMRRSSLDAPGVRTLGFGKRDSRKRWSVCGAERRGDLDLETIWED